MTDWNSIASEISHASGTRFRVESVSAVGGGSINAASVLEGNGQRWFVKLNQASLLGMFEAEAEGLRAMAATNTVRVPQPLCHGVSGNQAWLVMEFIEPGSRAYRSEGVRTLGRQLAAMHACTAASHGWHRDNTIGSTAQHNAWQPDWTTFWSEQRIGYQLELAAANGHHGALQRDGERLLAVMGTLLHGHQPKPSLLHGDLWSGNANFFSEGQPVIYDPACYYGDRETDLAMTELFGGFPEDFYAAYREAWPLDDGYPLRRTLYNLYHILNHLNLFGGGYAGQAANMISRLLAEVR